MMTDLEGNIICTGDTVYICDAAIAGSNSKRLLRGVVLSISNNKAKIKVYENGRTYSKTSQTIIAPRLT